MSREHVNFPNVPENIVMVWRENRGYIALCDLGDYVKLYVWDGMSAAWHNHYVFSKVDFESVVVTSIDPKKF